ncbi:zinc finger protein 12-like [Armigeres subalbatus]|uniref:zinc finger protein 12-like n=1 Tax=Armigeres subalbatus TaxID=124917 RepID=UPI002ED370D2
MAEYDGKYLLENFNHICRFCLSEDNCVEILDDGMVNTALEKAIDFIVSKVDENDGLPNKICQKCVKCVVEFAELEQRCQEAYEVLIKVSEQAVESQDCDQILREDDLEEDGITVEALEMDDDNDESLGDIIDIGKEELIEPDTVEEPEALRSQTQRKVKVCPICGKSVSQLSKHLPMHSDVKRHVCSFCSKQFAHDTTLRKHINSIHLKLKKYQCKQCQESFTDPSSLRYHNTTKHQNTKNFTCTICNKSYFTSTGLQQHNSLNHEQRKYKCYECGKMFAMKYHLKEHEKTHSDIRPYACNVCDRTFKRPKNLKEHLSVHKDEDV